MILTLDEKLDIVKNNPNKDLVTYARENKKKLSMHLYGHGLHDYVKRQDYFENEEIFKVRQEYILSNQDMFKRILNDESMIFTTRGGATYFNLGKEKDEKMHAILANVDYGISLHKWVETFALEAYRSDPMGVIFTEVESLAESDTPTAYPTYKSSTCIYDYQPNGRNLDYIVFELTQDEARDFGIVTQQPETELKTSEKQKGTRYFRFVDDAEDVIIKLNKGNATVLSESEISQPGQIPNPWGKVPGFIVSDLMWFADAQKAISPIQWVIELADSYLFDRSVRDLQKRFHGFLKAFEPLLKCGTCAGEGVMSGGACPDCSTPGANKGTGYKMRTKISDIARFPIEILESVPGFDVSKLFGYIGPDIKTWDKQDYSLQDLESLIYYTYWGCANAMKPKVNGTEKASEVGETATKSLINLQPKYARLNMTAEWAERCENMIADLIGIYEFETPTWKAASISYGRDYILETPEDILLVYQEMLEKGMPDSLLDDQLRKYIRSLYKNNPLQLHKFEKLLMVEPFPHEKKGQIDASSSIPIEDKVAKRYYGEWVDTLTDDYIFNKSAEELKNDLTAYVQPKLAAVLNEAAQKVENEIKIIKAKFEAQDDKKNAEKQKDL